MVGHCSDMPAALALADIVIAPSNEPEAFGRVAAEAGAMGVPAIGSSIGAQGEIIEHGRTGLIVPPFDPPALAAAILDLVDDMDARRSMAAAARAWARPDAAERIARLAIQVAGARG